MGYEVGSQARYRCRLGWGLDGVQLALTLGDVLVVVDTLRFSTAAIAAVHTGAVIYPSPPGAEAEALAQQVDGEVASHPASSRFSLSPSSYERVPAGTRITLPSPNGALCSHAGKVVPYLFIGALVNAGAAARAVETVRARDGQGVTVLACGERRQPFDSDRALRFALEDYVGAGAILAGLSGDKSPEARLCEAAFQASREELQQLLWDCTSGWELREKGLADDVRLAASLDLYDTVPVMAGDHLVPFQG